MDVKAVDFVRYPVTDLDVSLPFYRDTLGLTLEQHVEEYGWVEFALPPTTLALAEVEDEQLQPAESASIALAVEDVEDVVDELRETQADILEEPFDTGVCDMARIADPDGNRIELHRRHDGTAGRRDPLP